jgi:RND family efflux transporter MFP subunit
MVAAAAGGLLLLALAFAAGAAFTLRSTAAGVEEPREVSYTCPMHPDYRSPRPGDCPMCGMRLELVQAGEHDAAGEVGRRPRGTVRVSAERQQAVGVRLGTAERVSGTRLLRTTGRVAPDENATYAIVAGVSGWIRSVGGATTGTFVKRHERLASFYSPEFAPVLQSYYSGLGTFDQTTDKQFVDFNRQRVVEGVQRFADTLRNMGMSDSQLEEVRNKRELVQDIHLTSPVDGFVLQRNVSAGLRFDRGLEFYRIADLSRVWILADVYQHQLPFIRRGATARVTTAQENRAFTARVSTADPIFDEGTLTLKVRLEMANPGLMLKPGMFVDVEFPIELPATLAVPADAIVDSGMRKTVFVERGEGYFEPRQVETGWRVAGEVEVIKGLMPGERIVISGTFLIDSESRMRAAAQAALPGAVEDPVCGMQVDPTRAEAAGRNSDRDGARYHFCSDDCKKQFDHDPARFARPVSQEQAAAPAASSHAEDPICSMTVAVAEARKAGLVSERHGNKYYFCSDGCKKTFDGPP